MQSKPPSSIPKDQEKLRIWLEKILRDHYADIQDLYDTCTDNDRFEKLQQDNMNK